MKAPSSRHAHSGFDKSINEPTEELRDNSYSPESLWAWMSAICLFILSIFLVLFPRLVLFMSEISSDRTLLTPLESYLSLHLGLLLGAISITVVLAIPNSSPLPDSQQADKLGHPLLMPITTCSLLTAFLTYNTNSVGSVATISFLVAATIGVFGLWTILFAGSSAISRKTGADKHTSSFLFGNINAASVQKKQWKKKQRATSERQS